MSRRLIDSHMHLYDFKANRHTFLENVDPNYEAFVGDYSAMPRQYLLENFLTDSKPYQVDGIIWHEFLSTDPIQEVKWAQKLAVHSKVKQALVAMVDFLDPDLEKKLEIYSAIPNVTAVRQHMVWDEENPRKRFATRPDLLRDSNWQKQLKVLDQHNFKCGLEIFAHQLPDLINVIKRYPNLGFTVALMGWPLDISKAGFETWRTQIKELSYCNNVCVDISAIECIFGMNWTIEQVSPWILTTIEFFGSKRCMFGSHMPIAKLSRSFVALFNAYEAIVANFSETEKEQLFYTSAADWFRVI